LRSKTRISTSDIWKPSKHGLGHLLDPLNEGPVTLQASEQEQQQKQKWPKWIGETWEWILSKARDENTPDPPWFSKPAVSRVTVSSPFLHSAFKLGNAEASYADSVKPMNFVLTAQVAPYSYPDGYAPEQFHPIAGFNQNADEWLHMQWVDKYSGERFPVCINPVVPPGTIGLVSFRDALHRYLVHPEYKSADASGRVCDKLTVGLLARRRIHVGKIRYIGKESNRLEEVQNCMVSNEDEFRVTYIDPRLDPWPRYAAPLLKHVSSRLLAKATDISARMIKSYRKGAMPRPDNRRKLLRALVREAKRLVQSTTASKAVQRAAQRFLDSPIVDELG
jgi:hypothetical protein